MTSPPASPNVTIRPARIDDFASVSVLRHMLSRGAPARGRARPKIDTAYARAHYAGWIAEPGNWRIVAIVQGE